MIPLQHLTCALLSAALAGCALFAPVATNEAGRIATQAIDEREGYAALKKLAEDNKKAARADENYDEVTGAIKRDKSGVIAEVSVKDPRARNGGSAAGTTKVKSKSGAKPISMNFREAPLSAVIAAFMDWLKEKRYTVEDSFKDRKVTLKYETEATDEDVIQLFGALLDSYGVRLRYMGGVYYIGSVEDKAPPLQQPSPLGIGDAFGLFRLNFMDAREVQTLAKQVVRYPDRVSTLPGNVLVVNSTGTDVRAVHALVEEVDIPTFAGKYVLVYVPRHLSAASLVGMLDSALGQMGGGTGPGGVKQFEAKQVPESERIVVVAANTPARDLVVKLLDQADVPGGNYRRVFQYVLGTQSPADILPNLTQLVKSVIKSPAEINIVPDKVSNSLFIYASPEEYAEIRKVLRRMDFRPPAVYIDMVIAEVDLTNSMRYGVEWFLKSTGSWLASADVRLGFDVATTGGMAVGIISPSNNFATLQLLGTETTFSLLSSPKLVVRNGATAKIQVGSEQPVIKTKSTASGAGINTIIEPEYKKVGLEMEVTPLVSSSNEVRMLIKLRDTAITGNVLLAGDRYPILANRELNTDLVTSDGRTVFLGGIRRQDSNDTGTRIPGVGDLPYVGAAFRNKQMDSSGQELIILCTATVILDEQGAEIITRALIDSGSKPMRDLRPPPESTVGSVPENTTQPAAVAPTAAASEPGVAPSPVAPPPAALAAEAAEVDAPVVASPVIIDAPVAVVPAATAPGSLAAPATASSAAASSAAGASAAAATPATAAPAAATRPTTAPTAASTPAKPGKTKTAKPARPPANATNPTAAQ